MTADTAPAWPDMLTCPHCGGDELAHGFQYPPPQGTAQCYSCGAAVIADTEEEAIATWNRRTPSEQSAREAAAVAAGAREMLVACIAWHEARASYFHDQFQYFDTGGGWRTHCAGVSGAEAAARDYRSLANMHRNAAASLKTAIGLPDTTALDRLLAEAREEGRREEREACAKEATVSGDRAPVSERPAAYAIAAAITARSTSA